MPKYTYKSQFTTEFEFRQAKSAKTPRFTVIYIHGLCGDPWGVKPDTVKSWCEEHEISFFRFELSGHGSDKENFEKNDINTWKEQVLEIIDTLVDDNVVMCGVSLGGWLSLLAAIHRPQRVKGVLAMAPGADFTKMVYEKALTDSQKRQLETEGKIFFSRDNFTYTFTRQLIESGNQNCILEHDIPIKCPVWLLHGMKDASVPWEISPLIADKIENENVGVKLLKNATHRLNDETSLCELRRALDSLFSCLEQS